MKKLVRFKCILIACFVVLTSCGESGTSNNRQSQPTKTDNSNILHNSDSTIPKNDDSHIPQKNDSINLKLDVSKGTSDISGGYRVPAFGITSHEDQITIQSVVLNRGNCEVSAINANGLLSFFPINLRFGQRIIGTALGCDIIEMQIMTNRGTVTFTWPE